MIFLITDLLYAVLPMVVLSGQILMSLQINAEMLNDLLNLGIQAAQSAEYYYWGAYFGILFILLIYNLFLYFSIRDNSLLYYSLMLLATIHFETVRTPAFGLFLPDLPYTRWIGDPYAFYVCLMTIFYLLFVQNFLRVNDRMPRMKDYFRGVFIFYIAITLAFSIYPMPIREVIDPLVLATYVFLFFLGLVSWKKGNKSARFFVLASFLLTFSVLLLLLRRIEVADFTMRFGAFRPDNIGLIFFAALLSFAIGDKINILKKEKIEAQEKALIVLEEKVRERTAEVVAQRNLLMVKNREILDSIHYAKRIQDATMPSMIHMIDALRDGFVLYKPKDVVAGDFFWMEHFNKRVYFAAADCTGHGVPGAMVSVVCSNALTKSLMEEKIPETGKLLNRTREIVIAQLAKSGEEMMDGMDISLCALDFETRKVQWSGANNPLWIIRKGEVMEFKADKQPIGAHFTQKPFSTHDIALIKGDTIYIFTDGYQDQFGGPDGKKFKAAQMKKMLLSVQDIEMDEQKEYINSEFEKWRGDQEQIDDVCVIGVHI